MNLIMNVFFLYKIQLINILDWCSIGSLGWEMQEAGVQNVTVKTSSFTGTENGVRVKTWARPSNGFVRNVLFQHVVMNNVQNPIIIDQNYCPNSGNCPEQVIYVHNSYQLTNNIISLIIIVSFQGSGIKVSDITYEDVHGTSATEVAVKFDCSKTNPCNGIKLLDVKLSYKDHPSEASCVNAGGMASGLQQPTSCLQI